MAFKFVLPALALAGTVYAQCGSEGDTLTVRSASDLSGIVGCAPYQGSIVVDPSVGGTLALDGFAGIRGDLTIDGASNLTSLTADRLQTIAGTFKLNGVTQLTTLQMDFLTAVDTIEWTAIPVLQSLNFAQGISRANQVLISNTGLRDLRGIELTMVGNININNNPQLNTINVNDLTNVTQALSFSANGRALNIMLPNLARAANLTFRNVASVDIPSLARVDGSMGFYQDSFLNLSAPNLTTIVRSLAFVSCGNLDDLDLPELTTIGGGFLLANNSALTQLVGLNKLARIGGAIDFAGTFEAIALPALETVLGSTSVKSSSSNQSICDIFNNNGTTDVFSGNRECRVDVANPQANGTNLEEGGNDQSAASVLTASTTAMMTGAVGMIAALLFL